MTEAVARFGGRGTRELAELGGREAAEKLLARVSAAGGERLARRTVSLVRELGPEGLRGPADGARDHDRALDALPAGMRGSAVEAVNRAPDQMVPLVRRHGESALRAAARHPGAGPKLLETFPARGAALADRLSTDQVIGLLRHREAIRRLPAGDRNRLLDAVARTPGRIVDYLERHPRVLYTGAGLTAVLNLGNRAMRPDGAVREPDGTTRPSAPLDRAVSAATRGVFSGGFPGIYLRLLAVVAGGLLAFRILMAVRRFFGWLTAPLASSRRRADRSGATRAAESPADSRR
jgi:hypothetical protein